MNMADIFRDIGGACDLTEPLIESIYQSEVKREFHPLISDWLIEHGFGGLYNTTGDCGCVHGDLAPCDTMTLDCIAGHIIACGGCDGFHRCLGPKGAYCPNTDE